MRAREVASHTRRGHGGVEWAPNSPVRELRRLRIASTSSTNSTQGDSLAAREKMALTERTPSPSHLEATVLGLMVRKLAPHSAATALASNVFPVPVPRPRQTSQRLAFK